MSAGTFWVRARDLALTLLVFGGAQILLSLVLWPILFRSHPQGFAMALSLVGFGGWFGAFVMNFRGGRQALLQPPSHSPSQDMDPDDTTAAGRLRAQVNRTGCGTVLFVSGLLPLGLAFVLRIHADMQSGKTWSDIFPTLP